MTVKKHTNENQHLLDDLISWGLSKIEAEVYLFLLQKTGESGGSKIALGTGLHRQYVYIGLQGLIEKSLVDPVQFGKQKKYKARTPFEIEKITRKRAVEASSLVEKLDKISAIHNDQDFEVLQGVKQIQQFEINCAYEGERGEEEFIIGGYAKGFADLMGDTLEEYLEEKEKRGIVVYYLGNENEKELFKKYIGVSPNQKHRFMKELPEGVTHMLIRKDTVSFFSFLTPPLVYIIKSKTVADNYKQFFMMLWNMAKE